MVRHWSSKPVIIPSSRSSPTGGTFFFAVVNSFEYKNVISANFVQTVKNSSMTIQGKNKEKSVMKNRFRYSEIKVLEMYLKGDL